MTTFVKTTAVSTHGAHTLEGEWYTSPAIFQEEEDRLFGRRWLCVGRASALAEPGEYRLVTVGRESIILLRDRSGTLRAHFNVCRHRGSRLCEAESGSLGETIQCPYHAWTYGLDGRLIGVPDQRELEHFDRARHALAPVRVAEWEGFVFLNLSADAEPFEVAWAPMLLRVARWRLGALRSGGILHYDVRANWKLLFQNYSECYHCSPLHPSLVKLSPPTSGENDLVEGPFLGGFMVVSQEGGSLTLTGAACGVPVAELPEGEEQRVYYYSLFPNMLLSLHHDYVMVHTFQPVAPDRTLISCEFLFHPRTLEDPAYDPQDGIGFWDGVNREDWHICEQTQLGVASRAYRPGPYSRRESLSAAFDRYYRDVMASG
jgi:Rieske 2Fe-2S family protein